GPATGLRHGQVGWHLTTVVRLDHHRVGRHASSLRPDEHQARIRSRPVTGGGTSNTVSVAETLAALSLVTDLARGHPPEEAMQACLLAAHLGHSLRLSGPDLSDVYYTTLLRFIGCTATSEMYAAGFAGDDVDVRRLGDLVDAAVP